MNSNIAALFYALKPDEKIQQLVFLRQGLSNLNYRITTLNGQYLLKCYRNALPVSQLQSQEALYLLNIAPEVIAFSVETKTALFRYVPGHIATKLSITPFIKQLLQLHQFSSDSKCIDLVSLFAQYESLLHYKPFKGTIEKALAQIKKLPVNRGFCHNDLINSNVIKHHARLILIDFEYVQNNDVFFDLAALSVSYQLSRLQKSRLLNTYLKHADINISLQQAQMKLALFSDVYQLLCYFWYIEYGYIKQAHKVLAYFDHHP